MDAAQARCVREKVRLTPTALAFPQTVRGRGHGQSTNRSQSRTVHSRVLTTATNCPRPCPVHGNAVAGERTSVNFDLLSCVRVCPVAVRRQAGSCPQKTSSIVRLAARRQGPPRCAAVQLDCARSAPNFAPTFCVRGVGCRLSNLLIQPTCEVGKPTMFAVDNRGTAPFGRQFSDLRRSGICSRHSSCSCTSRRSLASHARIWLTSKRLPH